MLPPSACSNACHSDERRTDGVFTTERRTDGVFTTAVANYEENSTLGSDAMHSMLLLKKASSPGRGRWDGTPYVRVEDEGGALAPGAANATLIKGRRPLILVLPSTPFVKLLGVRHRVSLQVDQVGMSPVLLTFVAQSGREAA